MFSLFPDTSRLSRYVKALAEQMSTQKELRELKELVTMKEKAFEKSSQGVKQALETVELNNQWKINNYLPLVSRLNHLRVLDAETEDDTESATEVESIEEKENVTETSMI